MRLEQQPLIVHSEHQASDQLSSRLDPTNAINQSHVCTVFVDSTQPILSAREQKPNTCISSVQFPDTLGIDVQCYSQ